MTQLLGFTDEQQRLLLDWCKRWGLPLPHAEHPVETLIRARYYYDRARPLFGVTDKTVDEIIPDLIPFVDDMPRNVGPKNYYVNFRTLTDPVQNPEFRQITPEAFALLSTGRNVLMTSRGFAIYTGRMSGPPEFPGEILQYLDVPPFTLMSINPLDQDAPSDAVDMSLHPTPTPDPDPFTFDKLAEQIDTLRRNSDNLAIRVKIELTREQWLDLKADPKAFHYVNTSARPEPTFELFGATIHLPKGA